MKKIENKFNFFLACLMAAVALACLTVYFLAAIWGKGKDPALLAAAFFFRDRLDDHTLLLCGLVLALGVPFLLPYMHDRYYFLADVLTLAWACILPRRFPVAALVQLCSLSAYFTYLRAKYTLILTFGTHMFTMLGESLLMLAALTAVIVLFIRQLATVPHSSSGKIKKSRKSG